MASELGRRDEKGLDAWEQRGARGQRPRWDRPGALRFQVLHWV